MICAYVVYRLKIKVFGKLKFAELIYVLPNKESAEGAKYNISCFCLFFFPSSSPTLSRTCPSYNLLCCITTTATTCFHSLYSAFLYPIHTPHHGVRHYTFSPLLLHGIIYTPRGMFTFFVVDCTPTSPYLLSFTCIIAYLFLG